jgi:hypothetical protein
MVYNAAAELIFQTDMLYKFASFSANSRHLILADNQNICMIDLEGRHQIWQNRISGEDGMVSGVMTTDMAEINAVLVGKNDWNGEYFVFHHPKIMIFDREGKIVQKIIFKEKQFRTPALWISPQGDRFKVGFEASFYQYSTK